MDDPAQVVKFDRQPHRRIYIARSTKGFWCYFGLAFGAVRDGRRRPSPMFPTLEQAQRSAALEGERTGLPVAPNFGFPTETSGGGR